MFAAQRDQSLAFAAFRFLEVVYHGAVRTIRKTDGHAVLGLIKTMGQTMVMVLVFYVMLSLIGMRGQAIRGDYFVYLLSGISIFMAHVKTATAVAASEGPSSPMMQHAPMNTLVAIFSAALSALYTQILSVVVMLFLYHAAWRPITIADPLGAMGMLILAWYNGIGVGLIWLALKPWAPGLAATGQTIYARVNLFASGKMMVGNNLPFTMLPYFVWNPLFHIIDQARGYIFINYNPHFSHWGYAFWVSTALIMIGFIGEGYTRRHASLSWSAKR